MEEINRNPLDYLTYKVFSEETGEDVTEHCSVKVVNYPNGEAYDVIKINKRQITISTESASKDYDGKELTDPNYYMSLGLLADGHKLYVEVTGTQLVVGESKNTVNASATKIVDADGNNLIDNYKISWALGTLTVKPV